MLKYSRSISFFSLCRTQWRVGESGQPISVCRQHEHTEASRVKARHSETMDLPGLHGLWSLSPASKSVWYSSKYALINTASSISIGRSLIDVYSNIITSITWTFLIVQLPLSYWYPTSQFVHNIFPYLHMFVAYHVQNVAFANLSWH